MKIYLVGGAVRDQLLGITVSERDWVVVGATPEIMLAQGFQPVGKEFPVFLHPKTHEEYALARTERKVAKGYKGFTFYADPQVTLEQDLARRDLTINAMAQDEDGKIIDPWHGQQDLAKKLFRHVSPAFAEDPVRILRLARFASKLADFSVHPETLVLMKKMVAAGEVDALVSERVWQEFSRALMTDNPQCFFQVLEQCHALPILFPMIRCQGAGIEKIGRIDATFDVAQRFAVLVHDLSDDDLCQFVGQYRIPAECHALAKLMVQFGSVFSQLETAVPQTILELLLKSDALRREQRFYAFLAVAAWCYPENAAQHVQLLKGCLKRIQQIDTTALQKQNIRGKAFGERLYQLRLTQVAQEKESG